MKSSSGSFRRTCKSAGRTSVATPATQRSWKSDGFRRRRRNNEAFYQSMFMVRTLGGSEIRRLLTAGQQALAPVRRPAAGNGEDAQNGLAKDWRRSLKKYKRYKYPPRRPRQAAPPTGVPTSPRP